MCCLLFCSSRRLHTSCALVTGVQTCALPIYVESWRVRLDGIAHDYIATERPAGDADALIKRALSDATTPKPELKLNLRLDPQLATPGTYKAKVATAPATLPPLRSEEHTSELQSLMRISYAVFCLKNKNTTTTYTYAIHTTETTNRHIS